MGRASINTCSGYLIPPNKKQQPSTNNKFESTDPSREDWTTRISLWTRACTPITISTAFPKEAFIRPPTSRKEGGEGGREEGRV